MKIQLVQKGVWALGLLLFLTPTSMGASDWPEFRGPNGLGVARAANPPSTWSDQDIRWRVAIPGAGWSSPVVKQGKVYLTSAVSVDSDKRSELQALCLSLENGAILWQTPVFEFSPDSTKHDKNTHASPTPVVTDDQLFVHFGPLGTACLDLAGRVVWRQDQLGFPPVHGSGGSPALVGDRLVFHMDGKTDPAIVALDAKTGDVIWKQMRRTDATRKFSFSTPLLVNSMGRELIVSPASGAVFGYDPMTGGEVWRVNYGQGYSVVPRPVSGHGHVFVATGFGRPKVMAIRLGGQGDVTASHVSWETSRSGPNTPSMLVYGNYLYFVSDGGIVSCVEALSGKPVWQERVKGNISSSPVIGGDRFYLGTEEGVLHVLATGPTFGKLGSYDFGERIFASPALVSDALIIRTETHLYRIEKSQ